MNPPYIFIFLFDKRYMGKGIYPLASKNSYLNTDMTGMHDSLVSKCPIVKLPDYDTLGENEVFEKIYYELPTGVPFLAYGFYNGYWLVFGYIYSGGSYGILYGSSWNGYKHRCVCDNNIFSHDSSW